MPSTFYTLAEARARAQSATQQLLLTNSFDETNFLAAPGIAFEEFTGAGLAYQRITDLPAAQTRSLNADFDFRQGTVTPEFQAGKIYGLGNRVDRAAIRMDLSDQVTSLEMAARGTSLLIEDHIFNGDPSTDPEEFPGMSWWAANSGDTTRTEISAGATAGGAAGSENILRQAIDACTPGATHIVMGQGVWRRFQGFAATAGLLERDIDEHGVATTRFDGIPIVKIGRDASGSQILGFDEAAASGSATASSIYVISYGERGYRVGTNGGIVPDPTALELARSQVQNDYEVIVTTAASSPWSVIRMQHIGDLTWTA